MDQLQSKLYENQKYLTRLISEYEQELACLPKGSLSCETVRSVKRFYHNIGKERHYLSSISDTVMLDSLSRKRFIRKSLPLLQCNLKATSDFLRRYREYEPSVLCTDLPDFYPNFAKRFGLPSLPPDINAWLTEDFPVNNGWPEQKIHLTIRGEYMRSKSEVQIANALYTHGIPYRYERTLYLGNATLSPDFELLRRRDRKLFYWEHFGLVSDPRYAKRMDEKLVTYRNHGICQWDNLIVTFDSPDGGIDTQNIDAIINAFLI